MEICLVYPHQLFEGHPGLEEGRKVVFVEEPLVYGKDREWRLVMHVQLSITH